MDKQMGKRIVAFSGGVGGAKLALGLARVLPPDELLIVANTGDDFDHLGLRICPDIDTLLYTLGGRANRTQGWGIEGESWHAMEALATLGGPAWFRLGDRDLATHLYRTQRLREGAGLDEVVGEIARAFGIGHPIVPVSNDPLATIVATPEGELPFQDYFVRQACAPRVTGFRFEGAAQARLHPAVSAALADPALEAVVFCPSNPFVSIGPMLAVPGLQAALQAARAPVVAVSPIVGGQAIKGPAAKMMGELGLPVTALGVAAHYQSHHPGTLDAFVLDEQDAADVPAVRALGLHGEALPTCMRNDADKVRLAQALLEHVPRWRR